MSYTRKQLKFTLYLARGGEQEDDSKVRYDVLELPVGLAAQATVERVGGEHLGSAQARIFGLSLNLMNQVNTLGINILRKRQHRLKIEASYGPGLATVFEGNIQEAWMDLDSQPEASLVISALVGNYQQLKAVPPSSYRGPASAVNMMSDLAMKMGYTLDNQGVGDIMLTNHYLTGTAMEQAKQLAKAANIDMEVFGLTLSIWPKGGKRGETAVLLNKDTGLVGYPGVGAQNNVRLRCQFNPTIGFKSQVKVESIIDNANKTWVVYKVSHDLAVQTPGGPWFTNLEAAPPGGQTADLPL